MTEFRFAVHVKMQDNLSADDAAEVPLAVMEVIKADVHTELMEYQGLSDVVITVTMEDVD